MRFWVCETVALCARQALGVHRVMDRRIPGEGRDGTFILAFLVSQRSKSIALEARKEAESAVESVKGSVEKLKNNGLKTTKTVKTEGKKKTGEAVNGIKANGHAVAAGK